MCQALNVKYLKIHYEHLINIYIYISQCNITFMNLNALNFIYNFNFNNTISLNICSFYYCFFREQDVIFHYCIFLGSFSLAAQNNPVVIDLRYLYGSTLESNHNNKYIINTNLRQFLFTKLDVNNSNSFYIYGLPFTLQFFSKIF